MQTLFVVESNARIVKQGELIVVKTGDVTLSRININDLQQCVVMGNASITTPAVKQMLAAGIDVVFMARGGRFVGRLTSGTSKNILLRKAQFEQLSNENRRLSLAICCISGKIQNQRHLLLRYQKRLKSETLAHALVQLRLSFNKVETAADLDTLRGIEGNAAAAYFRCWPALLKDTGIQFTKRMRRPPPDPINVLLSFGYTMLGNYIHSTVESAGLDPYLGGLHAPQYGRPSLVLDLIEEFRPVIVDTAVLQAVKSKKITAADFSHPLGEGAVAEERWAAETYDNNAEAPNKETKPIIFLRSGIKKWLNVYYSRLAQPVWYPPRKQKLSYEEIIRAQVYQFAQSIKQSTEYRPFTARR